MSVILIFLDGVGVNYSKDNFNPFKMGRLNIFPKSLSEIKKPLAFNGFCISADASMGVEGLPQSATGQTALLTGLNAAKELGRHLYGFPNKPLKSILQRENIFLKLTGIGKKVTFANTYSPPFFDNPLDFPHSATTVSALSAGLILNNFEMLRENKSLYHDFTNNVLLQRGYELKVITPEKGGKILARLSGKFDFTLYEYFLSDKAGHKKDINAAISEVLKIERFLNSVIKNVNLEKTVVITTSDHGNLEDASVKTHTMNPVPVIIWGEKGLFFKKRIKSITDVTPAIVEFFLQM